MDLLPAPMEILEMSDGEVRELTVSGYAVGQTTITPRDRNVSKVITVVRLSVPAAVKATWPPYWDLTAGTLTAQLVPMLAAVTSWPRVIRLIKYGVAPKARYSVELLPNA
jgi:hypothetical protein